MKEKFIFPLTLHNFLNVVKETLLVSNNFRQARFLVWAAEIEARLERAQMGSPEEVLRHLETEVQAEVSLKSREADWLIQSGQELLQAEDSEDNSLHEKVEQLQNCWEKLQGLGRARAAKLNELLLVGGSFINLFHYIFNHFKFNWYKLIIL